MWYRGRYRNSLVESVLGPEGLDRRCTRVHLLFKILAAFFKRFHLMLLASLSAEFIWPNRHTALRDIILPDIFLLGFLFGR